MRQVIERLRELGAERVTELVGAAETFVFPMPKGAASAAKPPVAKPP